MRAEPPPDPDVMPRRGSVVHAPDQSERHLLWRAIVHARDCDPVGQTEWHLAACSRPGDEAVHCPEGRRLMRTTGEPDPLFSGPPMRAVQRTRLTTPQGTRHLPAKIRTRHNFVLSLRTAIEDADARQSLFDASPPREKPLGRTWMALNDTLSEAHGGLRGRVRCREPRRLALRVPQPGPHGRWTHDRRSISITVRGRVEASSSEQGWHALCSQRSVECTPPSFSQQADSAGA